MIIHEPIRILDAVTLLPVKDFDLSISIWRIIFEPIVGPMLFYLRAGNPVEEFFMLFIWIIIAAFILSLIRKISRHSIRKRLLKWVAMIPIAFSVWLAVLLMMIFAPLPSNRIANHNPDLILLGTHSHTHYSHDGLISQRDMKDWHENNGFDAFFITDHNHHEQTLKFIERQRQGKVSPDPLILCGEEFSGSNHILLLGFERNTITKGFTDEEAIDAIHDQSGSAIVAHWFEGERNSIQFYIDKGVDGFEIANQNDVFYPERVHKAIVQNCVDDDLLMIGSSDYHGYGTACFTWNALKIPGWHEMDYDDKTQSIMSIFRGHEQEKIQVIIYRDRSLIPKGQMVVSPLYFIYYYFRGLTVIQLFSWLIWIVIMIQLTNRRNTCKLCMYLKNHFLIRYGILGGIGSFILIATGLMLLAKVEGLGAYNDIHQEYGAPITLIGVGIFVYSLILMLIANKTQKK